MAIQCFLMKGYKHGHLYINRDNFIIMYVVLEIKIKKF